MKLIIGGKVYTVQEERNALSKGILKSAPLHLTLSRSGDHEYYGSLPAKAVTADARQTSHVEAGGVYYFKAWNAFSLNFRDMDISPYQVYVIGKAEESLVHALEREGSTLEVEITE